ncbi:unnamed protein product [Trifolium pratense]|uniref:Uncharacterized protein n=1 Tax=Trifolium pratense TaxID=57577 RepID=A0ACB0JPV9_TRIPR|nr:unnamed protein product [Trifolium pratense]
MGIGSPVCIYCGDTTESILHIMRDCPLAMTVWIHVVPVHVRDKFFQSDDLQHWLALNLWSEDDGKLGVGWNNYWAMACHLLWTWRNKEFHDGNFIRPLRPHSYIFQRTKEYLDVEKASRLVFDKVKEVVQIQWKPPSSGWIKLNTDGSCSNDGIIGCGGVLRGSEGEWLGGYAKFIGVGNTFIAELWGVLEGLKHAKSLNFRAVELNIDSLAVVQAISEAGRGSHRGSALVHKIRQLLEME